MSKSRKFVVVGLGNFGATVAKKLSSNGCRVTAMDVNRERVELLQDEVHEAVIGDATNRETMEALDLKEADAVIISLGAELSISVLATLHAGDLGAKRMLVKGISEDHARILKHLGVERVVFPKTEVGEMLADQLTWPNFVDYVPIAPEYSIVELEVGRTFDQKSLREADIRRKHGVVVLGIKDPRNGKLQLLPDPDVRMRAGQLLLVIGRNDEVKGVRELE